MNELLYAFGNIVNILSALVSIGSALIGIFSCYKAKKKDDNKKWKQIGYLAAGGVVFSVLVLLYANSLVEVPILQGKIYYDAKNILIGHGLDFNTVQGLENGIVTEQAPEAGKKVTKGTKVLMIVEPNITPANTSVPTPTNTPIPTNTPTPIPKYKVIFDSNGGSIVADQAATYGETLTDFPEPTRDYYRFLGWTYNGQKVTSINVEHDMVLVAQWEAECYTVSFITDGGSTVQNQTVEYGTILNNLPIPTKEQYTFDGWKDSSGNFVTTIKVEGNVILTASWTPYKTMYVYYHYTTGVPEYTSVCPATLVSKFGISQSKIYREEIWVDAPLYTKKIVYVHSYCGGKNGCKESTLETYVYRDEGYETNGIVWYDNTASRYSQTTILVPASTAEGVRR